jgi:hypothetical protein
MWKVTVYEEDMPIVVEEHFFHDKNRAREKMKFYLEKGEPAENISITAVRAQDEWEHELLSPPVFTSSELLTISQMVGMIDRQNPGYVDVDDLGPIKAKVNAWFQAHTGAVLR